MCKFAGCKQVYNDPRILPCGKRTCASHIESMIISNFDTKMIKCHFCQKIHSFPDDELEFPVDENILLFLNMKYCNEHDAAKKSFNEMTQLLDKLLKLGNEDYVIDFFERAEANLLLDYEINGQKLANYYEKLGDDLHERKVKCLDNVKANKKLERELTTIKQTLHEHEGKLKREKLAFTLKTLDGDDAKWRDIQTKCNSLLRAIKSVREKLDERLVGDQTDLRQYTSDTEIEIIPGQAYVGTIDSKILESNYTKEKPLVELCKLFGKQFKLIYRASQDGFKAKDFHAKCDNQPRTLTIIKTTYGYIFGGYNAATWDSSFTYKADPNAFIFSLINPRKQPLLIPIKTMHIQEAIFCRSDNGPIFGNSDIAILDNSNFNCDSFSDLGRNYDFPLFSRGTNEARSFLAGSYNFKICEIEVFQLF